MDKLISAIVLAGTGVVGSILAIYAKLRLVNRQEVFDASGRPLFQYQNDCVSVQEKCMNRTCNKIDDLKAGQDRVWEELKSINEKYHTTTEAIVKINEKLNYLEK
ncbi:MAG: hypothetical protein ACYTFW_00905 [Planctomycetota bacterium]|jgi:peptidoglycan hydrolase CwlO-like protein